MLSERDTKIIRDDIEDYTGFDIWEMPDVDIDNFIMHGYDGPIPKEIVKTWLCKARKDESRWLVSGSEGAVAVFMHISTARDYTARVTDTFQIKRISAEDVHEYF